MARLTQRGLARELGVNPGHVNRLKSKGIIVVGSDGLIDSEQAKASIAKSRSVAHGYMDEVNERQRETARETPRETSRTTPPSAAGDPAAADDLPDPGGAGAATTRRQFDRARTIRESFNASLMRLEFQQRSGLLVERAAAEKVMFAKARHARDAWLNWPSKTAPLIAAELGLDNSDALLQVMTAHVHKQISALGSDVAEFRPEPGA